MSLQDIKLGLLNSMVFVISFTNVEAILKIILLLVSIVYTVYKIVEIKRNNEANK